MYAHAIAALEGLCIRGEGGYTGTKCIPYTTKFGWPCRSSGISSFTCTGLREFDPTLAQEAISCFAENAGPRAAACRARCATRTAAVRGRPRS